MRQYILGLIIFAAIACSNRPNKYAITITYPDGNREAIIVTTYDPNPPKLHDGCITACCSGSAIRCGVRSIDVTEIK